MFRGKVRKPVSITLTPEHHKRVEEARSRLGGITRAELIALLTGRQAGTVEKVPRHYGSLVAAVEALGGSLDYRPHNGPIGPRWRLRLSGKVLAIEPPYALLDGCYRNTASA